MAMPVYGFDGTCYYINAGQGKINGIELEGSWQWKNWEFAQTATWNNSAVTKYLEKDGVTYSNPNRPFPQIPKWETNSRLNYYFHGHKMSAFVEYHYISSLTWNASSWLTADSELSDSLGIFNTGLKYNPGKWRFTVGVNDLFNRGPRQHYHSSPTSHWAMVPNPLQGRTYYFTTQYSF